MDNKNLKGKADDTRISLTQSHEIFYWTKKFGVSEDQLRTAVIDANSHMVTDVTAKLVEKGLYTIPE